jgi:hypothetical protein
MGMLSDPSNITIVSLQQWQNGPNRFKELRRRVAYQSSMQGRRRSSDRVLAHLRTPGGSTSTA